MALGRDTVLVLRALGLGDLLVAVPALRGLRAAYPGERLGGRPGRAGAAGPADRGVEEVLPVAGVTAPPVLPAVASAGLAVNLHGRGPQSTRALLGTARRWGVRAPGCPDWTVAVEEASNRFRWCRLLARTGCRPTGRHGPAVAAGPAPAPARCRAPAPPPAAAAGRRTGTPRGAALRRAGTGWWSRRTAESHRDGGGGAGRLRGRSARGRTDLLGLAALVAGARLSSAWTRRRQRRPLPYGPCCVRPDPGGGVGDRGRPHPCSGRGRPGRPAAPSRTRAVALEVRRSEQARGWSMPRLRRSETSKRG